MAETPIHRLGLGTDLHRLEAGGPLRLGGVDIPSDRHAVGHSDADAVLHALADALLGAAGLGDIGEHFPDTDPAWKATDSTRLLARVLEKVRAAGYAVACADVVIHLEQPKLAHWKNAVRTNLADLLEVPADHVGVKAKTNEGLDAVGRGEAVACTAVVGLAAAGSTSR